MEQDAGDDSDSQMMNSKMNHVYVHQVPIDECGEFKTVPKKVNWADRNARDKAAARINVLRGPICSLRSGILAVAK